MERDPKVLMMGEDVGKLGGVFRVTDGLQKDFGEDRVIDTPLAESGIMGTAVGLAMRGYRPVCEIQFDGFVYPAFDQIVSQVAKMHYRSQGAVRHADRHPHPVRRRHRRGRAPRGEPGGLLRHTAGLKVVACATPQDAYGMIQQAIACDDPVVFFEPKRRYWEKGEVDLDAPRRAYPLHASRVVRARHRRHRARLRPEVRIGAGRGRRGRGGRPLAGGHRPAHAVPAGPRPGARVGAAHRPLVVVHEAPVTLGLGAEIAARVTEECFYSLEAPVLRVAGFDTPYPPPGRGGLPARPGPGAGRGRPGVRVVSGDDGVQRVPLPDLGEGLTEAEILTGSSREGDRSS